MRRTAVIHQHWDVARPRPCHFIQSVASVWMFFEVTDWGVSGPSQSPSHPPLILRLRHTGMKNAFSLRSCCKPYWQKTEEWWRAATNKSNFTSRNKAAVFAVEMFGNVTLDAEERCWLGSEIIWHLWWFVLEFRFQRGLTWKSASFLDETVSQLPDTTWRSGRSFHWQHETLQEKIL